MPSRFPTNQTNSGVLNQFFTSLYSLDGERAEKLISQFIHPPVNFNFDLNGRGVFFISDRCNLNCIYCKGLSPSVSPPDLNEFDHLISLWRDRNLKFIHLTGLEPTESPCILDYFLIASKYGFELSMSTNGCQEFKLYHRLVELGLRYISISLDAHNEKLTMMMGRKPDIYNRVSQNILKLNQLKNVFPIKIAICLAVTHDNFLFLPEIVGHFIKELHPDDIRLIPVAQEIFSEDDQSHYFEHLQPKLLQLTSDKFPFLTYRIDRFFNTRGIPRDYSNKCYVVLDEKTVAGRNLYPCNIYIRERGTPITTIDDSDQNKKVWQWFYNHDCLRDKICSRYCCDVTREYNRVIHEHLCGLERNGVFECEAILGSILREEAIEQISSDFSLRSMEHLYMHLKRTALNAGVMGKILNWQTITVYYLMRSAFLHDVGKAHPELVHLNTRPQLDSSDRIRLREHTRHGENIIRNMGYVTEAEVASLHHERYDGLGYDKIRLNWPMAEIIGLADAYTALTEDRNYRSRYSPGKALSIIENNECGAFRDKYLETLNQCWKRNLLC